MRILICSSDYPPTPGGIAKLTYSTALNLRRLGHDVLVLATGQDQALHAAFDRQQEFATIRHTASPGLRELSLFFSLAYHVRKFRPDVLWSPLWFPPAWLATYCPGVSRLVHCVSTYGSEIIPNLQAGPKQFIKAQFGPLRRRVFREVDWIFALSRFTREQILLLGAPAAKIEVLPGGVDRHWFEIAPLPKDPQRPLILTVARLDEHKGHDVVLQALPRLRTLFPGLRYQIVGPSAGNWPRLESLAARLGVLDCVEYLGLVDEARLHQAYASADLFVMPSREVPGKHVEGFGLTYLEAAALGLPSVGGNSGGVPDAVEDGETGLLVDPNSVEEVGDAIARLLGDPSLLARLGSQARERAARFSWKAVARQMETTFQRLNSEKLARASGKTNT